MKLEILKELNAERAARRPVIVITDTASGEQRLVKAKDIAADPLRAELAKQLRMGKSGNVEAGGKKLFLNVYAPTAKLVIVGAVHISQNLVPLARQLGYQVLVVDPRDSFAAAERFAGLDVDPRWPDEAFAEWKPDGGTAIVTLTHDPKIDDPALAAALNSDAFYIASLGSRKTQAARLERLSAMGFTAEQLARIDGPAGLAIGAATPAEIALSILAGATAALRRA